MLSGVWKWRAVNSNKLQNIHCNFLLEVLKVIASTMYYFVLTEKGLFVSHPYNATQLQNRISKDPNYDYLEVIQLK